MKRFPAIAMLLASPWVLAQSDISKVNGSVRTEANTSYGELSSVNGSVHVASGVSAKEVETVNGSVQIGAKAKIQSASTVNGSILIGEDVLVAKDVETVSGRVEVASGSQIGGAIETTNGPITLNKAQVGGSIESVNGAITLRESVVTGNLEVTNGDITVGSGSHVQGDLIVNETGWFSFGNSTPPTVRIEAGAKVDGKLDFKREVKLIDERTAPTATPKTLER